MTQDATQPFICDTPLIVSVGHPTNSERICVFFSLSTEPFVNFTALEVCGQTFAREMFLQVSTTETVGSVRVTLQTDVDALMALYPGGEPCGGATFPNLPIECTDLGQFGLEHQDTYDPASSLGPKRNFVASFTSSGSVTLYFEYVAPQ
jgi:hypothetical protein